jgi:PAS domain S-box-containing protein
MSTIGDLLRRRPRYTVLAVSLLGILVIVLTIGYLLGHRKQPPGVTALGEAERAWLMDRDQLRFAGRRAEPPFGFSVAEGPYQGYELDLAESLGPILGVGIEVLPMTRGQALTALANGEVDAVMGMVQSAETSGQYRFTEPYAATSLAIFVRADRFDIAGWEDLRGQEVAVQAGTAAQEAIVAEPEISPVVVQSAQEGLRAVAGREVVALVADEISGLHAAQRSGLEGDLKLVGLPERSLSYSFAVRTEAGEALGVLDFGLASVEALGIKEQLDRAWFGAPVAGAAPGAAISASTVTGLLIVLVVGLFLATVAFLMLRMRGRSAEVGAALEQARFQQRGERAAAALEVSFTASGDLGLLEANRGLESLTGYPKDALLRMGLSDLVAPAHRRAVRAGVEKAFREGWASLDRVSILDIHGAEVPTSLRLQAVSESGRNMIVGTLRDEREAERLSALMQVRTRHMSAVNSIALTLSGPADLEEMLSKVMERVLELTESECGVAYLDTGGDGAMALTPVAKQGLTSELMKELGWPDDPRVLAEEVAKAGRILVDSDVSGPVGAQGAKAGRRTGTQVGIPLASKDRVFGVIGIYSRGHRRLTDEDIALLTTIGSQVGLAIENARLIQKLQRTVSEMGTMRRFSESVLQDMTNGLVVVDREGKVRLLNRAGESLLGCKEKDILGDSVDQLLGRGARVVRDSMDREVAYPSEEILVRRDGGEGLPLGMSVSPWRGEGGRVNGAVVILRDLSREKELEEERIRLDRLALLGEWSAVMAHEIRNPLAGMAAGIQHLLGKFPEGDERHEALTRIRREGERVSRTIDDILLISRPPRLNLASCDISELLSDVVEQHRQKAATQRIEILTEYASDLPELRADRMRLEQVLSNLLANAIEAMPNGGPLKVSVRGPVEAAEGSETDGRYVEVSIEDRGTGIRREDISKIFDPFFTTKPGGTGLGLPIARRIVEEHKGELDISSEEGIGTNVIVRLPLARGGGR